MEVIESILSNIVIKLERLKEKIQENYILSEELKLHVKEIERTTAGMLAKERKINVLSET